MRYGCPGRTGMGRAAVCLLGALLLLPALGTTAAASPWGETEFLETHLGKACDAIEAACEATYPKRPTLRLSSQDEVRKILKREWAPMRVSLSEYENRALDVGLNLVVAGLFAKYEPETNTVHVVRRNAERLATVLEMPGLLGRDLVRVVLIHEAVHALDFQRFPNLVEAMKTRTTPDGRQALSAVIEGHAQLVTERVAASLELQDAFATFGRAIQAEVPGAEGAMAFFLKTLSAETVFAYVEGHAFFQVVEAARGREGSEAVLRDPPAGTRPIERPAIWLDPDLTEGELDLAEVFEPVLASLEEAGLSLMQVRITAAQIKAQLGVLSADEIEAAIELYEDGRALSGQGDGGAWMATIAVLEMRDIASARAWVDVERRAAEAKDVLFAEGKIRIIYSGYEFGAPGADAPAMTMVKIIRVPGTTQSAVTWVYTVSRYVLEASIIDVPEAVALQVMETVQNLAGILRAGGAPPR